MNQSVLKAVTDQLSVLAGKYGFVQDASGLIFTNGTYSYKIGHDEGRKLLTLDIATVAEDGTVGEYENASTWLFEDPNNTEDAACAGMDFLDTLKGKLGIRGVRTNSSGEVVLPKTDSSAPKNTDALCAKTLALFPQYKENYKQHVSTYGQFLPVHFFRETLLPKTVEILEENNKKTVKKLLDFLSNQYVEGDHNVQNIVAAVVLGGAVRGSKPRYDRLMTYLEDYEYLKPVVQNIAPLLEKGKKAADIFGA